VAVRRIPRHVFSNGLRGREIPRPHLGRPFT
jgi:hypothetical protein